MQVEAGNIPKTVKKSEIMITPELWVKEEKIKKDKTAKEETSTESEEVTSSSLTSEKNEAHVEKPQDSSPSINSDSPKYVSPIDTYMAYKTKQKYPVDSSIAVSHPQSHHHLKSEHTKENTKHTNQRSSSVSKSQSVSSQPYHGLGRQSKHSPPNPASRSANLNIGTSPLQGCSSRSCASKSPVINSQLFRPLQPAAPFINMNPNMSRGPMGVFPTFHPTYPLAPPPHVSMILPVPMFIPMPIPIPIPLPFCPHTDHSQSSVFSDTPLSEISDEQLSHISHISGNSQKAEEQESQKHSIKCSESQKLNRNSSQEGVLPIQTSPKNSENIPLTCACCQLKNNNSSPRLSGSMVTAHTGSPMLSSSSSVVASSSCDEVMDLSQDKFKIKEEPKEIILKLPTTVITNKEEAGLGVPPMFIPGALPLPPPVDHAYSRRRGRILDAPPPPRDKSLSPPPDKRYCRRSNPRDIYTRKGNLRPRMRTK